MAILNEIVIDMLMKSFSSQWMDETNLPLIEFQCGSQRLESLSSKSNPLTTSWILGARPTSCMHASNSGVSTNWSLQKIKIVVENSNINCTSIWMNRNATYIIRTFKYYYSLFFWSNVYYACFDTKKGGKSTGNGSIEKICTIKSKRFR